ncbi:MAG: amino acid ABC transporter substrate-binding protein [Alphaproteobacteria bacterium]
MRRRRFLAILPILLVPGTVRGGSGPTVRIGFSVAQSGLFAGLARAQQRAYELWRDRVNEAGGLDVAGTKRPVEFIWYDDQSSPAWAARIYESLIVDDRVDLLLAPWGASAHRAVAPVLARHGFPLIATTAPTTAMREVAGDALWFASSVEPGRVAEAIGALLVNLGIASVAIATNELSAEFRERLVPSLAAREITVAIDESYPPDVADLTPTLTRIKDSGVEGVVALTQPADAFLYMAQARDMELGARFQFLLAGPALPSFAAAFGKAAEGLVTAGQWTPDVAAWPGAKPFAEAYAARFGATDALGDAALAYVSCEILEQAVATAGLDRAALRAAIAGGSFDTINGPVRFTGSENAITPTALLQLQDGAPRLIWPPSIATAGHRSPTRSVFTPLDEPIP